MTIPPVTGIEAYTAQSGQLSMSGQHLMQEIVKATQANETNNGALEERIEALETGTLIGLAEAEILRLFGDTVSVADTAKSMHKFGALAALGTSRETIRSQGGNEVLLTTNAIDTISSSSGSDTGIIAVSGHTVVGVGVDAKFTRVDQYATLNGQNKVTLDTPLARCDRMFNSNGTSLVGQVNAYEDTAISGGVPSDATKIHNVIEVGHNQTFKAATTTSDGEYLIITTVYGDVKKKTSAVVDFFVETQYPGKVFRERMPFSASTGGGSTSLKFEPFAILPPNSEIRVRGESSASNTGTSAHIYGFYAQVEGA